jgi:hypothetical protein
MEAQKTFKKQLDAPFFAEGEVIVLTRNGTWVADGIEVSHEPTRRLFSRSLKRHEDGYYLHIGWETKKVQVEDTAYFVIRIDEPIDEGTRSSSSREYQLTVSDGTTEILDPTTLRYQPGRLTCTLSSKEEARFLQASYIDLLKDLQEDETSYFLEWGDPGNKLRVVLEQKVTESDRK